MTIGLLIHEINQILKSPATVPLGKMQGRKKRTRIFDFSPFIKLEPFVIHIYETENVKINFLLKFIFGCAIIQIMNLMD